MLDMMYDIGTVYATNVTLNNAISPKVINKADSGIANPIGGFIGSAMKLIIVIIDVLIIIAELVNMTTFFLIRKYGNLCINIIPMREL